MNGLPEGLELEEFKLKVPILIHRINQEKELDFNEIAKIIGEGGKKISKFYKWKDSVSSPKANKIRGVVEKLEKLLEKSISELQKEYPFLKRFSTVDELEKKYAKKKSSLVIIYLDFNSKTEIYKGEPILIGGIVEQKGKKGILAYKNDSTQFGDADGLIYMLDPGMESLIKYGSRIALKKINIMDCQPGYFYYIIDRSGEPYFRKLITIEGGKFIFISDNESRIELESSQIVAIFRAKMITYNL
jgi:hypothetical protein